MLHVKSCDYSENLQLWSTNSYDQLPQLAALPQNPTCINTQSISIFLATRVVVVVDDGNTKDDTKSITFDDGGKEILENPTLQEKGIQRFLEQMVQDQWKILNLFANVGSNFVRAEEGALCVLK